MEQTRLVAAPTDVDENKRRGGNRILRTPTSRHTLDEGRFACTKVTLQANHIARLQYFPQARTDPARLLRAPAEKIHCMFVQNGHRRDYIRRMDSTSRYVYKCYLCTCIPVYSCLPFG